MHMNLSANMQPVESNMLMLLHHSVSNRSREVISHQLPNNLLLKTTTETEAYVKSYIQLAAAGPTRTRVVFGVLCKYLQWSDSVHNTPITQ